jgi:two-component system OmpR family response regulator
LADSPPEAAVRILVVEDDPKIASFVSRGLREAGHAVDLAADGPAGLALAIAHAYDVAIVDVMLPGLDGLALVTRMREHGSTTPVLILSARRTVDDRVKGRTAGGDDYLTKPFAFAELAARVQALARRAAAAPAAPAGEPTRLVAGELTIDLVARRVERAGRPIELRPREFALLELLARHAGEVVPKTMIMSQLWGYSFDPRTNVVDVLVHRLREKLDQGFERKLLRTVRGVGYVLETA